MSNVHTIIHASERPTYLSTTTHLRMRCAKSAISCLDKGFDPSNDMEPLSRMLMKTVVGCWGRAAIIIYRIKTPTMVQNTLNILQSYSGLHVTRPDGYLVPWFAKPDFTGVLGLQNEYLHLHDRNPLPFSILYFAFSTIISA